MGEKGAYRDAVLLNAAAALIVAGEAQDLARRASRKRPRPSTRGLPTRCSIAG
jgi:hypothetical protein